MNKPTFKYFMQSFIKKPVIVEGIRFNGNSNKAEVEAFVGRELKSELESETAYVAGQGPPMFSLIIETKEGEMKAMPGDWILKEPFPTGDRDFYPCKNEMFQATYQSLSANVKFGTAIEAVKIGKRIARQGWNEKNMFVFLRPADELTPDFIVDKVKSLPQSVKDAVKEKFHGETHYASGDEIKVNFGAYLCLYAADGSIANGWLPSQTDVLAEDWVILD